MIPRFVSGPIGPQAPLLQIWTRTSLEGVFHSR